MGRKKKEDRDDYYFCSHCNDNKHKRNFYTMMGKYEKRDNLLPICKQCIKEFSYYDINKRDRVQLKKFQTMLMRLDLPFDKDIYHSSYISKDKTVGRYFNTLQLKQYRSRYAWRHSRFSEDEEENEKLKTTLIDEIELMKQLDDEDKIEVVPGYWEYSKVLADKWGTSYSVKELIEHEKIYLKLKTGVVINTEMDMISLIDACKAKRLYDKAMVEGASPNNIDKLRRNKDGAFNKLKTIDSNSDAPALTMLFKQIDETEGGLEILEKWRKYPRDEIDMLAYIITLKNKEHHGINTDDFMPEHMHEIYDKRAEEYKERLKKDDKHSLLDKLTV